MSAAQIGATGSGPGGAVPEWAANSIGYGNGGNMAGRAVAKSGRMDGKRVALLLGLSPRRLVFWASAKAQPMQLVPRGVESAALLQEAPAAPATLDAAPAAAAASVAPAAVPAARRARYNVVVLGDSLGDGTWAGLYHVLRQDKVSRHQEISRRHRLFPPGLFRLERGGPQHCCGYTDRHCRRRDGHERSSAHCRARQAPCAVRARLARHL